MAKEYIRSVSVFSNVHHRGPVLCFDDMEENLKWFCTGTGSGYTASLDDTYVYYKSTSLLMSTRVTNAAEDDEVECYRTIPLRPSLLCELSFYWFLIDKDKTKYVRTILIYDDTENAHAASVRYTVATGSWQIKDGTGEWKDIAGATHFYADNSWHHIKFAFDFNNKLYLYLEADGFFYDLSSESIFLDSSTSTIFSAAYIAVVTSSATPTQLAVDDFLAIEQPFF